MNGIPDEERVVHHTKRFGRELAMQYLFCCEMRNELPGAATFEAVFDTVKSEFNLKEGHLTRKGREYAEKLYELTALHHDEIDRLLSRRCENWDWKRISPVERNIMRVAVAEMLYIPEVPPVVSIDEAVEIARDYSGADGGNFINGVLNAVKNELQRSERKGNQA